MASGSAVKLFTLIQPLMPCAPVMMPRQMRAESPASRPSAWEGSGGAARSRWRSAMGDKASIVLHQPQALGAVAASPEAAEAASAAALARSCALAFGADFCGVSL